MSILRGSGASPCEEWVTEPEVTWALSQDADQDRSHGMRGCMRLERRAGEKVFIHGCLQRGDKSLCRCSLAQIRTVIVLAIVVKAKHTQLLCHFIAHRRDSPSLQRITLNFTPTGPRSSLRSLSIATTPSPNESAYSHATALCSPDQTSFSAVLPHRLLLWHLPAFCKPFSPHKGFN